MSTKNYIKSISLILLLGLNSCMNYHIRKGNRSFENLAYSDAIKQYENVYPESTNADVAINLADAYYKTSQIAFAEGIYAKLISQGNKTPKIYF